MTTPTRITVVRALPGLGDMLCALPAMRSIRAGAPDATITVVGNRRGRWFGNRFPELVDDWVDLPWWPGIVECEGTFDELVAFVGAWPHPPDALVQLHGSGHSINWIAEVLRAVRAIVHVPADGPDETGRWAVARPWPDHGHEIDRLCDLVEQAGFPPCSRELAFPLRPAEVAQAATLAGASRLAVVHPGASRTDRRWAAAGFGAAARAIADEVDQVWVTAGPGEEPIAAAVCTAAADERVVVAPSMPLGVLGAVLAESTVTVVNDTGVAHLAVAVGCPTVVVRTTSDTDRWGPRDLERHRVVGVTPAETGGVAIVDVDRVVGAAGDVLVSVR